MPLEEQRLFLFMGMSVVIDPEIRSKTGCDIVFMGKERRVGLLNLGPDIGDEWNGEYE